MKEIGIYIHIPFCVIKCKYCDFVSYANKIQFSKKYVEVLKKEISFQKESLKNEEIKVTTIYIGGGTPSYIESELIVEIMEHLKKEFNINEQLETTIEINPGSVTEKKIKDYILAGINRISIGLQTTDNELLFELGRIHTYNRFLETYKLAKKCGIKNINIDLMLGIQNQTIEILEDSINKILELKPQHISVYSLIVEAGTKLERMVRNKKVTLPNEETERQMYWLVDKILKKKRFIHYEISNYAKKGYESKHNVDCWEQKEYLGFGVSAHSYINKKRYSNTSKLEEYLKTYNHYTINEIQDKETQMKEYMLLGLRKLKGIKISEFKTKFNENPLLVFCKELDKLVKQKLLKVEGDNIYLTKKGIDLANLAWEEFV